ncbi:MAG: ADP-ribose pyrophosphatase [bacterium ADurb.Bin270]|nr:MAG: ADP-ribose pyrophosphatase [bacterium ADurb.Bin270]
MKKETIYSGKTVTLAREETILPSGVRYTQEIIHHPGGACVLPIFDNGDVLLLRQYRYAAGGYIWEAPAGKLDVAGEDPAQCASRELIEEAGYRASNIEHLITILTAPGFCDERLHLFKGSGLTPEKQDVEENEVIEVHRFARAEISKMLASKEILDAKTLITLKLCGY